MDHQTKFEMLCTNSQLYSEDFISRMGHESPHWEKSSWFQREASLRHDMVCMLLCNTEPIKQLLQPMEEILEPPKKKAKIEETSKSTSSSSSSSFLDKIPGWSDDAFLDMGEDEIYRYILLEGRSNVIQIQNKICELYKFPVLTRQYDIFDRRERKFCEVKVTLNQARAIEEFHTYRDPETRISLIHINPETIVNKTINKRDEYPGLGKVISFLTKRLVVMRTLGIGDVEIEDPMDVVEEVMGNIRLNESINKWVESYWSYKDMVLQQVDKDPQIPVQVKQIIESELKNKLEDTTKRKSEFMQFKGKLLPDQFTYGMQTQAEEDKQMLNELLENTRFDDDNLNWVLTTWEERQNTFNLVDGKGVAKIPLFYKENLGIGMKNSIRFDGSERLRQEIFSEPPRLRYSAWMSNLIKDITDNDENGLNYFSELTEEECPTEHPIGRASQQIINKLFTRFGQTTLASYCSKVKNFYSRLGGAYLKRGNDTNKRPAIVIFPLYSSGKLDEVRVRHVTGFALRGPQHAKKSTDRIPFITFEILGHSNKSRMYQSFIKKPKIIKDNKNRVWCARTNSIQKQDTSYLSFVIDSIYLTANMVGEMTFANLNNAEPDILTTAFGLIERCDKWLLERMAESVLMAVLGNSQEEGVMAGLRKIFMLKLNWVRGDNSWGSDIQGFADSINECLMDQPLALYFAKQYRDCLEN